MAILDSKRCKLISAAKGLLWKLGYESMSPRKILSESGAGQGSLYHHFKGKKHLAAVALEETATEMCADADRMFDESTPPLTRLRRYLEAERDGMTGCQLGRFANEQSIHDRVLRKPIERYFQYVHRHVVLALQEAKQRGDIPKTVNVESLAVSLLATVQGGYTLSRIYQDGAYVQHATRGAWRTLQSLRT